ncbi:hypothetical protein BD31_I0211, partial [Candidatus Nitrosopumilus salaria BD31]
MERIFDRQSKIKINELKLLEKYSPSTFAYYEFDITEDEMINHFDLSFNYLFSQVDNLISNLNPDNLISNYISAEQIISPQINIDFINDQIFDPENPILLILLIPFAGFILIRYDNEQIKFYHLKQFFTLIFVTLLVSSAVITPLSISSSYWGYAFADMDNSTDTLATLNSENITQENITQENITQENIVNIPIPNNDQPEINFNEIVFPEFYSLESNNQMSISDILSITLSKFGSNTPDPSDLLVTDSNMSI